MKVHIEGSIYLESDERQYVIKEYSGRTYGEKKIEHSVIHGYFTKIEFAIKYLVKMQLHKSTAMTLSELRHDVLRIDQYIRSRIDF